MTITSGFLAPNKPKDKHYAVTLMRFLGLPVDDALNIYEWQRRLKDQQQTIITTHTQAYSLHQLAKTHPLNLLHAKILLLQAPPKIIQHFNIQADGDDVRFEYPTIHFELEQKG
jgi:hypothetical protein